MTLTEALKHIEEITAENNSLKEELELTEVALHREVEEHAKASASIIVAHNHPSGDPTPSREDVAVTKRLVKAGNIMDIQVLDHIIIGDSKYLSMKEKGQMD